MTEDDDLARYQPPRPRLRSGLLARLGRAMKVETSETGTIVTVRLDGEPNGRGERCPQCRDSPEVTRCGRCGRGMEDPRPNHSSGERDLATHQPTRYAEALRRQAANRSRRARGEPALPELRAGNCKPCEGWGVVGPKRLRCQRCNGTGEES